MNINILNSNKFKPLDYSRFDWVSEEVWNYNLDLSISIRKI